MSSQKAKPRGPNYSTSDKGLLLDCVSSYLPIVQNKRIDNASLKEKRRVWDIIAANFNEKTTSHHRTIASLQICYENLKKVTRKRASNERVDMFKTGDGRANICKPNPIIDRVREFIQPTLCTLPSQPDRYTQSMEETDPLNSGPSVDGDVENMSVVWVEQLGETSNNQDNALPVPEDDVKMAEHNSHTHEARKKSNWQRGMTAKLRESKYSSFRVNMGNGLRRRAPPNRIGPSLTGKEKSLGLVDHKLELTKVHLKQAKAEGDIKIKILETELKIKEALLAQELVKLAKLNKESELNL